MRISNKVVVVTLCSLLLFGGAVYADESLTESDDEQSETLAGEMLSRFWELEPEHKRGIYQMRTYQANYLLPIHYTDNVNVQPRSPSRGESERRDGFKNEEVKIQISLRTKVLQNFLLPSADVWVAYTQTSLWQAWNSADSAPFRSTDHNPEIFYVVPLSERFDVIPGPVRLQMLKLGFAHHSNGQSEPMSRSWNYWNIGGAFEVSGFLVETAYKLRINEGDDDNPDIERYAGNFDTRITGRFDMLSTTLTRVSRDLSLNKGSWQLDFTYPLRKSVPEGARFHLQIFSGYGETLTDYNHYQNRIGIGIVLLTI